VLNTFHKISLPCHSVPSVSFFVPPALLESRLYESVVSSNMTWEARAKCELVHVGR